MKTLVVILALTSIAGDEPGKTPTDWLEVARVEYDGSKDGRVSQGGFPLGGLIIDRLQGDMVAVFLARPLKTFNQRKDLQVVFLDEQDRRHVAEEVAFSSSRVERVQIAALLYVNPRGCPPDDIRAVIFEQMSNEALRARLAVEKRAKEEFRARVLQAVMQCPLPGPVIGQPYAFKLTDIDGRKISTDQWRGKVIVIEFWATWCGPCVAEVPALKQLYERYHREGLEVLGISHDHDEEKLRQFIGKNSIPWPQGLVGDDVQRAALRQVTGVSGIPRYFVIDRAGKLRTDRGRGLLEKIVPQLLEEPD